MVPPAKQARAGKRTRDAFASRGPSKPLGAGNATYRISVGHRQRVLPGSIVGALANEGGLHSGDIGSIDIRADHSLVELPANLPAETVAKLAETRIGGRLINLEPDTGRRPNSERYDDGDRGDRRPPRRDRDDRGDRRRDDRRDRFEQRGDRRGGYERRDDRGERGGDRGGYGDKGGRGGYGDKGGRGGYDRRDDRGDRGGYERRNDRGNFGGRDGDRNSGGSYNGSRNSFDRGGKSGSKFGGDRRNDGGFGGGFKDRKPRHK